jgi:hypothetical protein
MNRSAKVIAFPVRAPLEPPHLLDEAIRSADVRRLNLWLLLLLAPLLAVGSIVLFLAVVGVFLVWFVMVMLLVAGVVLFARRLLWRRARPGRAIG